MVPGTFARLPQSVRDHGTFFIATAVTLTGFCAKWLSRRVA
jgi:hypothetical protein